MIKEGKIGLFEAVALITVPMITKIFYTFPATLVQQTGTAAWYTMIISLIINFLFLFGITFPLFKRFPGKNGMEIFELTMGRTVGKVVSAIFVIATIFYSGSNLREFTDMIKVYNLLTTPVSIVLGIVILTAMLMSYLGFETITRISALSMLPVLAGIVVILLLAAPSYDPNYLKPYLGYGIKNTLQYGFWGSSAYYTELGIIIPLASSLHGIKAFRRTCLISGVVTGVVFTGSILCYLAAFGYTVGSENVSGMFELSRLIWFGRFLQRLEPLFLFIWVIAATCTVASVFYLTPSIFCKVFEVKNHRPLIVPVAFLVFMAAVIPKNLPEVLQIYLLFYRQYFILLIIPALLIALILAIIRKKGGQPDVGET